MRLAKTRLLLLAMSSAIAAVTVCLFLTADSPLRWIASLLLLLVLPGYGLISAVIPQAWATRSERVIWILGSSISVDIVGGLSMGFSGVLLSERAWLLFLGTVSVAGAIVGLIRSRAHPFVSRLGRLTWRKLGTAGIVAASVCIASIATVMAINAANSSLTSSESAQIWMLEGEGQSANVVHLGVKNNRASAAAFSVQLSRSGKLLAEWTPIELAAGRTWETTIILGDLTATGDPIRATLKELGANSSHSSFVSVFP